MNYKTLLPYAMSTEEKEILEYCSKGMTQTEAALAAGMSRRKAQTLIYRVRDRAAVKGVGEEYVTKEAVDDSYYVKGTSTLYDKDGNPKLQWVKTNIQAESLDKIAHAIVSSLVDDVSAKSVNVPLKRSSTSAIEHMNMVVMGDPHIGVYVKGENGDKFGLEENVALHKDSISYLLDKAPDAEQCVILSVGDTLHADNPSNRTTRSGAALDVDTDWYTCVKATVELLKFAVNKALESHSVVKLINLHGNHDDYSSYCLNLILDAYYSNNPRVIVDTGESRFMYHVFGGNLFGFTHGDSVKIQDLESIMAHDMSEEWWRTNKYFHTGHIHHKTVQEFRSVTVESHRTLAKNDKWHNNSGYRAKKEMKLITYHDTHGECSRIVVSPSML